MPMKKVTFAIPEGMYEQVRDEGAKDARNASYVVREAIGRYLKIPKERRHDPAY